MTQALIIIQLNISMYLTLFAMGILKIVVKLGALLN
jgi:hypothetical protein